jgi:hypothetical protein
MNKHSWLILVALLIVTVGSAVGEQMPGPSQPIPEPGYLEVIQMTAVELDGRLPGGAEPVSYHWVVIEGGDDGRLFDGDKQDAVFLAPKVAQGTRDFLLQLTVTYREQAPSVRRLKIRVLSEAAANASGDSGDDTQWLQDFYKKAQEKEDKKQSQAPTIVVPNGGTTMRFGMSPWGWGWGGSMGFAWTMNYPISQPVSVPPPGETHQPGEGSWDMAKPVPYGELSTRFPSDVADRYSPADDPTAGAGSESDAEKSDGDR